MTDHEQESDRKKDDASTVRHEEEVSGVDTRWRGIGHVRAQKRIVTERVRESIPRDVEDVELARVPVEPNDSGEIETLADGSISIPVYEEELVITKKKVLRERVIVRKQTVTQQQRIRTTLQKERVSVEADPGIDLHGLARPAERERTPALRSSLALAETRPFFLTSELLVFAALAIGLVVAGLTDALEARTASILAAVAVAAYILSRGLAKSRAPYSRPADENTTWE